MDNETIAQLSTLREEHMEHIKLIDKRLADIRRQIVETNSVRDILNTFNEVHNSNWTVEEHEHRRFHVLDKEGDTICKDFSPGIQAFLIGVAYERQRKENNNNETEQNDKG